MLNQTCCNFPIFINFTELKMVGVISPFTWITIKNRGFSLGGSETRKTWKQEATTE